MKARIGAPKYGGSFDSDVGVALPFVLPGELVEAPEAANFSATQPTAIVSILESSSHRVEPGCVHFSACGGCHYQHANYPDQVEMKVEILRYLLVRARLAGLPVIEAHHAADWGYRNRIRVRVERCDDEVIRVGYSRRGSNEFLPIEMCPIAAPLLWCAAARLAELAFTDALCRRWLASVSEVELFCTADESCLQLMFFMRDTEPIRGEAAGFAGFCERLKKAIPELSGAGAAIDPELSRPVRRSAAFARWTGASWGAEGLAYDVVGRSFWVSRGSFFQVNRMLIERLVTLATTGFSGELAWDLFAGVGLFTHKLLESFDRVVAVEGGESASLDLRKASRGGKGVVGFEAVRSSTLEFLRAQQHQRERPGLIVLDPPRAGLGAETCALLARIAAPDVVYVSCDPTTLVRDLADLTRAAYRIEALHMLDLFPQTFHMESVVHLRRR